MLLLVHVCFVVAPSSWFDRRTSTPWGGQSRQVTPRTGGPCRPARPAAIRLLTEKRVRRCLAPWTPMATDCSP
eukprot:6209140-Prymnesium_polylepis.1